MNASSRRLRAAALAALAAALAGTCLRAADEGAPIQRSLVNLSLGDSLEDVEDEYPPAREWPSFKERRTKLVRVHIEADFAKGLPEDVEMLVLGLRRGKLVHIQVIFNEEETRRRPLHALVEDFSSMYGEPRRRRMSYAWDDGRTVLRASNAEVPSEDGGAMEFRTSLEVMDRSIFGR